MLGIPERLLVLGGMWFIGCAAMYVGAYLLRHQKVYLDSGTGGVVDIEIPWLGRFRTNYPALAFLVVGAALVIYPVRYPFNAPPTVAISGRITAQNGAGLALIPVSIISYRTFTDSDGAYSLDVVRREGEQYWAVSVISRGKRIEQFHMGPVSPDPSGRLAYSHAFDGDGR